jgi:hypothetical protein
MEPVFAPVCSEDSSFLKQNVIATICCQKDDLSSALSYIDHLKKLTFFFCFLIYVRGQLKSTEDLQKRLSEMFGRSNNSVI